MEILFMNTKFKKLALTAGITAALAGISMPTYAIIEGATGEALLVPFVVYADGVTAGGPIAINTIVELTVPGSVGHDTIPNNFTASHTTPTNNVINTTEPVGNFAPRNKNLPASLGTTGVNNIHWYFFNSRSEHKLNGTIPVSADLFYLFNWGDVVLGQQPSLTGVKGYLIFGTDAARTGAAADFSMFGDAFLVQPDTGGLVASYANVPVLPLNDGIDAGTAVTVNNQVIYDQPSQIPSQASPLISGMRTNYSDGKKDSTMFDLTLSNRNLPTVHVFWNDLNQGATAQVVVYDDTEKNCSMTIPLLNELNVTWISPTALFLPPAAKADPKDPNAPGWIDNNLTACRPSASNSAPGFIRYVIPEPLDTNIGTPESAAVAFSFQFQQNVGSNQTTTLPSSTALGHELGKFK
jgi:hypothetical protein